MTENKETPTRRNTRQTTVIGWSQGGVALAVAIQVLVGIMQGIQGLAALINDELFLTLPNYIFAFDFTTWGWIHLVLAVLLIVTGIGLAVGSRVAAVVSLIFLCLSAGANFFFLPLYPLWAILIIAVDVFAMWSIAKSGLIDQ
ncbi:DUF7144 family membrane protein [Brevibacterium linens]|uniref:DUF7144 family membrane protein n=1 Tax=Brevibacterium linens TaxID=1703 RepID=UPI003BF479E2